jgi:hypothetical protein
LPGSTGQSSNPLPISEARTESCGYWIARSSRAMTDKND